MRRKSIDIVLVFSCIVLLGIMSTGLLAQDGKKSLQIIWFGSSSTGPSLMETLSGLLVKSGKYKSVKNEKAKVKTKFAIYNETHDLSQLYAKKYDMAIFQVSSYALRKGQDPGLKRTRSNIVKLIKEIQSTATEALYLQKVAWETYQETTLANK